MGQEGHEKLLQGCRPAYTTFRRDILSTRPHFSPHERRMVGRSPESNQEVVKHKEDADMGAVPIRPPMYVDEVSALVKSYVLNLILKMSTEPRLII